MGKAQAGSFIPRSEARGQDGATKKSGRHVPRQTVGLNDPPCSRCLKADVPCEKLASKPHGACQRCRRLKVRCDKLARHCTGTLRDLVAGVLLDPIEELRAGVKVQQELLEALIRKDVSLDKLGPSTENARVVRVDQGVQTSPCPPEPKPSP